MEQKLKKSNNNAPVYEHYADDPFYLFLKKETFLFDEPHYHESVELIYMIRGKAKAHLSGETREISEGDIFICNKQQVHFYENYPSEKLAFCVVLSNKYTHDFREIHKNAHFPSFLTDKEKNKEIYGLLCDWFNFENGTFLSDCAFANLLLDKIVKLYGFSEEKPRDTMNKMAIEMINYISDNYYKNVTLETAAKHFGYAKEYFSKIFKQTVGKNFLDCLNTMRTQKAMEMLNDPERKHSISEVCAACGFNNAASLYRHLKQMKS